MFQAEILCSGIDQIILLRQGKTETAESAAAAAAAAGVTSQQPIQEEEGSQGPPLADPIASFIDIWTVRTYQTSKNWDVSV